jgi:Na+(H+)/acetate symporter ActP
MGFQGLVTITLVKVAQFVVLIVAAVVVSFH